MKRYGQIIRLRPEFLEKYAALHAHPWPEVNQMIRACNIRNYTIYHHEGFLFACFEYVGEDYEGDMAKMAADPKTQEWWSECNPCQQPVEGAGPEDWWVNMKELYHLD